MNTCNVKQQQTFSFSDPAATSVLLVGDFTHWQERAVPLRKQAHGAWKGTIALLPGTYHYRFIVDGEWRDDPACTLRVNNPFGTQDAVLVVAGTS